MIRRLILVALALASTNAVQAHHSATIYDKEHPVEISGIVKKFRWVNPHTFLSLEVPTKAGTEVWEIEGPSVMMLARNGWKSSSLPVGEKVRVLVAPQKDGRHAGSFMRVFLGNGTVLETGRIE